MIFNFNFSDNSPPNQSTTRSYEHNTQLFNNDEINAARIDHNEISEGISPINSYLDRRTESISTGEKTSKISNIQHSDIIVESSMVCNYIYILFYNIKFIYNNIFFFSSFYFSLLYYTESY